MTYQIQAQLEHLYGREQGARTYRSLTQLLADFSKHHSGLSYSPRLPNEKDSILITYSDIVQQTGIPPLRVLDDFLSMWAKDSISTVHILPFFPYSSDDGFSIIDYSQVNPDLGGWNDVEKIGKSFKLMFDAVINHISAGSAWYQGFLAGEETYQDYFITVDPSTDLSAVVRPRPQPLLIRQNTRRGPQYVWATFSADQIDLNYHNPDVLLEIIAVLLLYISKGAEYLRLDAIGYLWKEIGTSCIHLPQTHQIIQLFRSIFDQVAPYVKMITETNVAHTENISYFGNGFNEAHMVYNFSLPPLVLHSLRTGNAAKISSWVKSLGRPSDKATFFNFLASHDGIGLNPARGILSEAEIDALVKQTREHGGYISYKSNPDGSQSPYELNINYFDALSDPQASEPVDRQVKRFISSQAIMLALAGLPGIYFHSLFGSRSWAEGVKLTGQKRSINREKLDRLAVDAELRLEYSIRHQVYRQYISLLRARAGSKAFNPYGAQETLDVKDEIFALLRISPDKKERALCLHNLTPEPQPAKVPDDWPSRLFELINQTQLETGGSLVLPPYGIGWYAPYE